MEKKIEVQPRHDSFGVEICGPDDVIDLSIEEAEKFYKEPGNAIKVSKKKGPGAPAPLFLSGHIPKDPIAECGRLEKGCEWYGGFAKYEIGEKHLDEIANWIAAVKKYIKENK
jgi:hypothetical protein